MGDFEKAKSNAEETLKLYDNNPWALNILGVSEMNLGNLVQAKQQLEKSLLELNKMDSTVWGQAYSGDDPKNHEQGFQKMKESVRFNLSLVTEKLGK